MRLIDADVLYERACELEAQALEYVGKIIHDDEKIEEWRKWSAILNERTAFKHDVYDAPTIEERKTGKWIEDAKEYYEALNERGPGVDEDTPYFTDEDIACSECLAMFSVIDNETERWDFCPNCGAKMEAET